MRKRVFFGILIISFILTGCADADDFFLKISGVVSAAEYQQYIDMRDGGELDAEGHYVSEELEKMENEKNDIQGSVHVTFAHNSSIAFQYYRDEMHEELIDEKNCYVNPGDYIYASEYDDETSSNAGYSFEEFCLYAYNSEGKKGKKILSGEKMASQGFEVPKDFDGTEISVIPVGKYNKRKLKLKDYYMDSTDREQELNGRWIVNGDEITGGIVEISPVDPIVVEYQYDADKYAYDESNQDSYYHENGLVKFDIKNASDDVDEYRVELRPLSGVFVFDPNEYSFENGIVKFEYEGSTIEEKKNIPDGATLIYDAKPNEGFVAAKNVDEIKINVNNSEETEEQIRGCVQFYENKMVNVTLPKPIGGTIEYCVDEKALVGNQCELPSGTEITMCFVNWNGWINNLKDGRKYIVTDRSKQSVSIEGLDINKDVFKEDDEHKPLLNVVVADSAKDAIFDIGNVKENLKYAEGNKASVIPDWMGKKDRIIFSERIGTYPNPVLDIREDTVFAGKAVKLEIEKTDTAGQKEKEIIYIQKLPADQEIEIYKSKDRAGSSKVYKEINVIVSKVDVVPYEGNNIDCAKVFASISGVTVSHVLNNGDVLEESCEVEIEIIPDKGFYIADADEVDGIYRDTMKYSTWKKECEKIYKKHPVKQIWHVTLDTNDEYGECVYILDEEEVEGNVEIREEQKLTLHYNITNPDYEIGRSGISKLWKEIVHKETEDCVIPISKELDGKVIKRQDYIEIRPRKEK